MRIRSISIRAKIDPQQQNNPAAKDTSAARGRRERCGISQSSPGRGTISNAFLSNIQVSSRVTDSWQNVLKYYISWIAYNGGRSNVKVFTPVKIQPKCGKSWFSLPKTNYFGPFPSFSIRINIIKKCLKNKAVTSGAGISYYWIPAIAPRLSKV